MKILLTGASGLVGAAFAAAAQRRGHQVVGVVGTSVATIPGLAEKRTLDLTETHAATGLALELFPDAIVNCAAVSQPAACEADPARAQSLNVTLPATLAKLAHHLSARLVHVSTEQVFAGDRAPYAPGDAPQPLNLYGRQKLESERLVHVAAPEFAATVRAPLLTGNSLGGGRSLHERLLADWAAGRAPRLYRDEIRQPCTAGNLAEVLLELCERPELRGVFHWAGAEAFSRVDLAKRIRAHFKLSPEAAPIKEANRADDPGVAARRAADLRMELKPLAGRLKTSLETFDAQLDQLVLPPAVRAWYFAS
ncbi:MAG: SDR family oxidoreductase [Verrucomicrobia bacterium]|nr:SDR family oxidoreductase [Verrucomicrobiota bacterium]